MKTLQKVAIILFCLNGVYGSTPPMKIKPYVKIKKLNNGLKKNNIINGDKKSLKKKNIIKKTFFPSMATNNETVYLVNDKASATFDYASLPAITTKMDAVIEGSIPDYINKKIILSKVVPSSKDLMDKYSTTENPSKIQPVKNLSNGTPSKIVFKTIENNQPQSSDFVDVLPQFQEMQKDESVKSSSSINENQTAVVTLAIDQNKEISSNESNVKLQDESVVTKESNQKFDEETKTIKEENSTETPVNLEKKSKKDKTNSPSNAKEDNDESNTNPPSSYKSDENKKVKRSKIIKKIKKLIKKLPKDKKDNEDKEKKDRKNKNDGKYFVTININELGGNLVASFKKLGEIDPCIKIGGEVLYSKWQLNFEAPMKIDKHSKDDKSLVGFNSQLNFYHPLNGKSRKFFLSIPFGKGSKIDERINSEINEKDFGSNTDWTKGKCFFMALNDENYSIGLGWINGVESFGFNKDSKDDNKDKKHESHCAKQFIQGKTVLFDKLVLGAMVSFENLTNVFNGNLFTDYELFNSGKLAANPVKISVGGLLKYIFGQDIIEGYQKDQKDQKDKKKNENPFKIEKGFLKDDLKGSFGAFNVTVEIKKIKINGENINLKLTVELKLTQKINQWSLADKEGVDLKSGTSITVEWRIFKIKLSFKELKIDFKNLTQKHKFLFNPYELKMKKADYLLTKDA
jgi:hypothetical protein